MSLIAAPEALAAAAGELTGIGTAIKEAAAAAAPLTSDILAAAGDEVSAAIASLFGSHAVQFQALSAQTTLWQTQFARALSEAAAGYASAEAANAASLGTLLQQLDYAGLFTPIEMLLGRPLFASTIGPNTATVGALLNWGTNAVGLGGVLNFPSTVAVPGTSGVRIGFSFLQIPVAPSPFLGLTIPQFNYPAPAFWYFPTQPSGAVTPTGTVYLQHGFAAIGWFYQPLAMDLALQTNSVVVTPTIPSIPLPFGVYLNSTQMQQGVASLFLGGEPALNTAAHQAGYTGTLPQRFILSGHSAGGGLATMAANNYISALGGGTNNLAGVVMFDGVANDNAAFAVAATNLKNAGIPLYVVAAPPQPWNAYGATTNTLVSLSTGKFSGVEIVGGSHVDSMLGGNPVVDFAAQLLTGFSPPGATAAVHTLATGWINDIYNGFGPTTDPAEYGIYGPTGPYIAPGGQQIILGQATGIVL